MSSQAPMTAKAKKPYAPPAFVRYGELRTLTQAGTSGSTEGSSGTGIMKPNSDRRTKENIVRIGEHPFGVGLYLFDYRPEFRDLWGHDRKLGVMADEVETVMPQAVSVHANGYKVVDYAMLGIFPTRH